ncbi:MAG: ABC transporter ATP-binding protein [Polyangiaceae bacterium]|nr:ABC transporter ATP-binding protein [Polyangiaceae bacterium]
MSEAAEEKVEGAKSYRDKAAYRENAEVLIKLRNVVKEYERGGEKIRVLQALDLDVPKGSFEALMGPSGSGKTTLLNLIAGLDRPTEGTIDIDGKRIDQMSEGGLAGWRANSVGFIFQSYNLLPVLTAIENVELPLLLTPVPSSERRKRAETALRVVGLDNRMDHYPRQLSGGQEQRVAIARAIVNDPILIVADEPTGDLDRQSADDILALLDTLNRDLGKTIMMVTHDPAAAERAAIVHHLDKGALRA